jgi:predicted nuclease with TOPRIM domain
MKVQVQDPSPDFWGHTFTLITSVVSIGFASLSGVIGMMYRNERESNREAIKELKTKLEDTERAERRCLEDHEKLSCEVSKLEERLCQIERRIN